MSEAESNFQAILDLLQAIEVWSLEVRDQSRAQAHMQVPKEGDQQDS